MGMEHRIDSAGDMGLRTEGGHVIHVYDFIVLCMSHVSMSKYAHVVQHVKEISRSLHKRLFAR